MRVSDSPSCTGVDDFCAKDNLVAEIRTSSDYSESKLTIPTATVNLLSLKSIYVDSEQSAQRPVQPWLLAALAEELAFEVVGSRVATCPKCLSRSTTDDSADLLQCFPDSRE